MNNSLNIFPQYCVTLRDVDCDESDQKATLIISLMQTDFLANREKHLGQYGFEPVNVKIFKLLKNYGNVSEKHRIDLTDPTKVEFIGSSRKMNTFFIKLSSSCV